MGDAAMEAVAMGREPTDKQVARAEAERAAELEQVKAEAAQRMACHSQQLAVAKYIDAAAGLLGVDNKTAAMLLEKAHRTCKELD